MVQRIIQFVGIRLFVVAVWRSRFPSRLTAKPFSAPLQTESPRWQRVRQWPVPELAYDGWAKQVITVCAGARTEPRRSKYRAAAATAPGPCVNSLISWTSCAERSFYSASLDVTISAVTPRTPFSVSRCIAVSSGTLVSLLGELLQSEQLGVTNRRRAALVLPAALDSLVENGER